MDGNRAPREIVKRQKLMAKNNKKLWRGMIAYILNGHGVQKKDIYDIKMNGFYVDQFLRTN